ncbi:hypothetical protein BH23ACT7_BH23ACT7_15690 [soil metagenome]
MRGHNTGPFPYPRALLVRAMALMWTAGGAMVLVCTVLPHPPGMVVGTVVTTGVLALVVGAAAFAAGARFPSWVFPATCFVGTWMITVTVVAGGGGTASVSFSLLYVWVVIYSLLFFSRPVALFQCAAAAAAYGVAHQWLGTLGAVEPLLLAGTLAVAAAVVAGLEHARDAASVDPLTRTSNRRGLDHVLEREMERARTDGWPLTVGMLDIDHFKQVNDRHGHEAGDRLLTQAVECWQGRLRPGDSISRFGGDEFVVVLPRTTPSEGRQIIERLRADLPGAVTFSAGVAAWLPHDSMSMLLSRVDAVLYEAKRGGRDRTVVNGDDDSAVRALSAAIRGGEFVVFHQPTVSLRTGRITGFEALVRWQHPERGLLPPSEFIPLAEDSGLIVQLGEFVLDRACRDARGWLDRFPDEPAKVSVNVSGRQLDDPGFTDAVACALRDSGLPARLLTIEVTETVLAASLPSWAERLWDVRRLGVQLAMDDFGTGYSSLNQLRRLPFGVIKVDRSFVEDLPDSPEAAALVDAMVGIGRALGLAVVAEGVETAEQLAYVRGAGCDEAQGFLLGRPAPADVAARLLERQSLPAAAHAPGHHSGDRAAAHAG